LCSTTEKEEAMPELVHWEIPVTDMKRAQEFYEKLFG
jgi:predicted enzyme related to lactoylglutathione lyase